MEKRKTNFVEYIYISGVAVTEKSPNFISFQVIVSYVYKMPVTDQQGALIK